MELYEYRIRKSKETLEEAAILYDKSYFIGTINRLYYALFYVATAALLKKDVKSKTHSGTKSQFHNYFIRTGILSESLGELYDYLFETRQEGDYQDFFTISKEETRRLVNDTQQAHTTILNLIQTIDQ